MQASLKRIGAAGVEDVEGVEVELELDMLARMRWQALLSVEDMIREAHTLVDELGATERTIWLYTSCDAQPMPWVLCCS